MRWPRPRGAIVSITRSPQYLPVPLGGMTPVRAWRPHRSRPARSIDTWWLLTGTGVVAALLGLVIAVAVPAPGVGALGTQLRVGGSVLHLVATRGVQRVYGGDAVYVLTEPGDGTANAVSTWQRDGRVEHGRCAMRRVARALVDECVFTIAGVSSSSIDTFDLTRGALWRRTYADGHTAVITVPPDGAVVPVAFPIGS